MYEKKETDLRGNGRKRIQPDSQKILDHTSTERINIIESDGYSFLKDVLDRFEGKVDIAAVRMVCKRSNAKVFNIQIPCVVFRYNYPDLLYRALELGLPLDIIEDMVSKETIIYKKSSGYHENGRRVTVTLEVGPLVRAERLVKDGDVGYARKADQRELEPGYLDKVKALLIARRAEIERHPLLKAKDWVCSWFSPQRKMSTTAVSVEPQCSEAMKRDESIATTPQESSSTNQPAVLAN